MGMSPSIEIVLGISVLCEETTRQIKKTKYDSDTGEPYEHVETKTECVLPDWLDKLYDREYDHGHVNGTLAAFDDNVSSVWFFVGKLIDLIDPRKMNLVIEETADSDEAREVWEWLRSVGCKNVLLEDVKIRLRSVWF